MPSKTTPSAPAAPIRAAFARHPPAVQAALLRLRKLIFQTAERNAQVGSILETLKWGAPSYLTPSGSGTTLRLESGPGDGEYALRVHCQTRLVEFARGRFGDRLRYDGRRGLIFRTGDRLPEREVIEFIKRALTYHVWKRRDQTGTPRT